MENVKININGISVDVPTDEISKAIETGEYKITNEELIVKTKGDFDSYIENVTGERYRAGKEKAEKDAVNNIAKEYGVELDDTKKTVKNLIGVLTEKIASEAKKEPTKQVQEALEEKKKALDIAKDWELKFNDIHVRHDSFIKQQKVDALMSSAIPENVKTKIPLNDLYILFKNKVNISFDENGNEIVERDGKKLQNPTNLNNLTVKEVFGEFIKAYIEDVSGGSGGGDNTGGSAPGTLLAFQKEMSDKGVSGIELNREMEKRIKAGTLKI